LDGAQGDHSEVTVKKARVSILVFGIYMVVVGLALLAIPNVLLSLFAYPATTEIWIRILGFVVVILGYYYLMAARFELTPFSRASVYGRPAVIVCFAALVLLGMAKRILVLFGVVDLLGAIWTGLALRSSQ
jgi:Kef-type K+ transport system membrane component KefB